MSKSIKPTLGSVRDDIPDDPPPAYSEKPPLLSNNPYQGSSVYTGEDKPSENQQESESTSETAPSLPPRGQKAQLSSSSSSRPQDALSHQFSHMSMDQSRDLSGYPPPTNPNAIRPPQVGMPHPGPSVHPQGQPMPHPGPSMRPPPPADGYEWVLEPGGIHPAVNLPLCFKVYADSSFTVLGTKFYIGRQKGEKLHAVPHSFKGIGNDTIALHEGPSTSSRVLGNAVLHTKKVDISLQFGSIVLHRESYWGSTYHFDFPLRSGAGLERFEWESGKTPEVRQLGGNGKGWTLYRARTGEPVAAYEACLSSWSLSGRFAFLNSGATPEFGADWCVMAVVSAFAMGQKKRNEEGGATGAF